MQVESLRERNMEDIIPDMDEMEEGLKKRDSRFVVRLVLSLSVALLAGVYAMLWLGQQDVGGCTAQGFDTLTDTPASAPSE